MPTMLAFDLATVMGIAYWDNTAGSGMSSVWNFSPRAAARTREKDVAELRFKLFADKLKAFEPRPDLVIYEDVQGHVGDGIYAAQVYGGFKAILCTYCLQASIPYICVHTGTLKKFITGHGNATKAEMIQAMQETYGWTPSCWKTVGGVKVPDDNEADAAALLRYGSYWASLSAVEQLALRTSGKKVKKTKVSKTKLAHT